MGKEPLMRIVLDTNVVVSALLFRGVASRLIPLWQKEGVVLLISRDMLREYLSVLAYPRFQLSKGEIRGLIEGELLPFAEVVGSTLHLKAVKSDPSDDKFLECAVAGKAKTLVSGDKHLLDMRQYRGIRIMSPSQFLTTLSSR